MTQVTPEAKQSKIQEFADLLRQRDNAVQKKGLGLELSEYETDLINSPYQDWLRISTMLETAEIEDSIYDDFLANPTHYKITDGVIVYNSNWETEAQAAELERIGKLHITKQDFYTYICVPANISYDTLKAKIAELNMQPQWELCNHVYYGVIQPFLTALPLGKTEQEIIEIFEAHTPADE